MSSENRKGWKTGELENEDEEEESWRIQKYNIKYKNFSVLDK